MAAQPPLATLLLFFLLSIPDVQPLLFYGCSLFGDLCETNETCYPDGLFGECTTGSPPPLVLDTPLDSLQSELIRLELKRLSAEGFDWRHPRSQCVLAYFKLSIAYQLRYNPNFCAVRNPANVWSLLQEALTGNNLPPGLLSLSDVVGPQLRPPGVSFDNGIPVDENAMPLLVRPPPPPVNEDANVVVSAFSDRKVVPVDEEDGEPVEEQNRIEEEPRRVRDYVDYSISDYTDVKPQEAPPSDEEIENLANYVQYLDKTLQNEKAQQIAPPGEAEEAVPLNVEQDGTLPLKKDIEHLGNLNTGLDKVEHKIVKGTGTLERVDGNRVYMRVERDLTKEQLYQLVDYLNMRIAKPNKLVFDEFQFDGEQLSFRVSRAIAPRARNEKRLDSVEGIAEAVYKRRKDIETFSGVHVDETGIGSGEGVVPVESDGRDGLFTPILLICALTITVLVSVLGVHQYRVYQSQRKSVALPQLAEQIEGKSSAAYQDLCRHRMSAQETNSGTNSKNSSTSSWCEEPISHSNMDISTGHVILTFLQEYLQSPTKIEEQWATLQHYRNPNSTTAIAQKEQNMPKNRNPNCLPYDDTLISVLPTAGEPPTSTYINASAIHDTDPRQPIYIATQAPLPDTVATFWQMIWEQGAVLIVNLANEDDLRANECIRYWPENGSQLHGVYEIHLVSEHIWSEDYLVRSFYLKNLKTNETRTITQFHYLTWPKHNGPATTKALLEFRRKVNKSYRGRAAPIVVHCTDGCGRTGSYCLLDMVLNRITKGIKEMNIAGSLEHLRDQRAGMVQSGEQYKVVFSCLAEEITAMVKALPR